MLATIFFSTIYDKPTIESKYTTLYGTQTDNNAKPAKKGYSHMQPFLLPQPR
jgi:hypothetical protein